LKTLRLLGVAMLGVCALSGCNSDHTGITTVPANGMTSAVKDGGTATLSWQAPSTTTDGAPLMDLGGYRIYYGTDSENLNEVVGISSVGIQTYVIDNLQAGTWFFAIRAVTTQGVESALSDVVSKTI
jgi:hypothetical protein